MIHLNNNDHRAAVVSFRAAEALLDPDLSAFDTTSLIGYATALERIGVDSRDIRVLAAKKARDAGDEVRALDALAAGLPEAESTDGDEQRVADLSSIDRGKLESADRQRHSLTLARQMLLAGQPDVSMLWADKAMLEARTTDETAAAWLAKEHVTGWRYSASELVAVPEVGQINDATLACRVLQAVTVGAFVQGDIAAATERSAELAEFSAELGDPLRSWHSDIIRALLAEYQLDLDGADTIGEAALANGVALGLPGAVATREAQLARRAAAINVVGSSVNDPTKSAAGLPDPGTTGPMARASGLRTAWQRAEEPEAVLSRRARKILTEVRGSRFEVPTASILAPVLSPTDSGGRSAIRSRLEPLLGTAIIIGAGVASLGPVEGVLAHVARSPGEQYAYLRAAVESADRWEAPFFQLVTRLAMYNEIDRSDADRDALISEATDIARSAGHQLVRDEETGRHHLA